MSGPDSLEGVLRRFRDFLGISPEAFQLFRAGVRKIGGIQEDDFRISDVLRELGAPVLIIHAPDDEEVPFAEAEAMSPTAQTRRCSGPKAATIARCSTRRKSWRRWTDFLTDPRKLPPCPRPILRQRRR